MEASESQSRQISSDNNYTSVYSVKQTGSGQSKGRNQHNNESFSRPKKSQTSSTQCSRCGIKGHASHECRCSRNVTCHKCHKVGHFASVCRSKSTADRKQHGSSFDSRDSRRFPGRKSNVCYVGEVAEEALRDTNASADDDDSYTDEYAYALDGCCNIPVLINGVGVDIVIDSGASCNTINTVIAKQLKEIGTPFNDCRRLIHPYGSSPIPCHQLVSAPIQVEGREPIQADFLVVPGNSPPLLGKETAERLGVLSIGVKHLSNTPQLESTKLYAKYPGISDGIGCLKNTQVTLHIDKTVPPVARKHDRTPFHMRTKVAAEIQKLEQEGIIEKVSGPTEWVSRIVTPPKPKSPNEIRLCVDMRDANRAILRTRHITPTIDELTADLNGATVFSKLDLKSGYHQLELHPSCRYITTFSTHVGLYQYKRLSFGINSAAEIFQHTIQTLIADIPGARNVSDDIVVYGSNQSEHDAALDQTLRRLHESGLTVNPTKCEFNKPSIEFFGYIFSADGLAPAPEKVKALQDAAEPRNPTELRSFLGMAQYSARFIRNFATITEPLRKLTRRDATWKWEQPQTDAFNSVKAALSAATAMPYFSPHKETKIIVDASPVGIAGILVQDDQPIAYGSRALSDVESRYSQTEREALAIVWACEHFDIYVRGASFTVVTDHKPLVHIWNKPHPPLRIARWSLRLQPYDLTIEFRPGKDNPADYMSRHPVTKNVRSSREEKIAEEYVDFISQTSVPNAITLEEVQAATSKDKVLQTVIELCNTGRWHDVDKYDVDQAALRQFQNVRDELTVNRHGNLLLRNTRIVVPTSLQARAVQLAHEGHQGISKTKALIRSKVWFPGIDTAVEDAVRRCVPCQANTTRQHAEPLNMSNLPRGPWINLSIDFCGPLPSGQYLMVITDEYSRFPIVEVVRSTAAEPVIQVVDKVFCTYGYPDSVKTDNGPPFNSQAWKGFLKTCGIKHRKITPLWPKANGQVENFNKPLMKAIKSAKIQGQSWIYAMHQFLRAYRCTPHTTTGFTPYRLLFGRDPRTKMPDAESFTHPDDRNVRKRDAEAKDIMKRYADKRLHAEANPIDTGDTVLVKQPRLNKLSTPFNPTPLVVTERKGTMVTAQRSDGSQVTRNVSMFRSIPQTLNQECDTHDDSCENILPLNKDTSPTTGREEEIAPHPPQLSISRPKRTVRPPRRLIEEI